MALTTAQLAAIHRRVTGEEQASLAKIARELGIKPDTLQAQHRNMYGPLCEPGRGRRPDYVTPAVLVVVRLHVLKGGSVASIARELGMHPVTLRKHYRRAKGETGWYRTEAAELAFRDWRHNARARDGLDRLIAMIRVSWRIYPPDRPLPVYLRPD